MNEVVAGHVVVEAIDLVAVMSREEIEDLVQEVLDFDDGFVRERWRIDSADARLLKPRWCKA
jgi:hypothetical protein